MTDQLYCVLDYETYSEAPLKKVGAWEYSVHPSTEILCIAWRVGTRKTLPKEKTRVSSVVDSGWELIVDALSRQEIMLVAHNALFEQVITRNVLGVNVPPSRWICTASLAASLALPRSLEGAAAALGLKTQKDMVGRRLINKWCKPRKPTKKNPATRHTDPEELKRIMQYCATDVDTETELFLSVPPLNRTERKVWELDQKINLRGFKVDRQLVQTALSLVSEEIKHLNAETHELTGGRISTTKKVAQVKDWLASRGLPLPDLQKKTVEDVLKAQPHAQGPTRRMLEIRAAESKTSTAKYEAFERRSRSDGRLRDILVYHGASTGRWAGSGAQIQNLPRGHLKDTNTACKIMQTGDLDLIRMIYGDPMEVLSSCLRGMIITPEGKVFDVADYSAIEARGLFWVAGHEKGLQAFREERDLYCEQASEIFNRSITKENAFERFVGKQVILGSGYGMGPAKFEKHCEQQGQPVTKELAERAVAAYRATNKPVTQLWWSLNHAAICAVNHPGKEFKINKTKWFCDDRFLWCELPSSRRLAYYGPQVKYEPTKWSQEKRPVLYHWGVDSLSKKWVFQSTYGGKLTENVVQAVSRDLMAEAMLRIDATKIWQIVLTVHDELVAERAENSTAQLSDFTSLMERTPIWASGFPIKVEGWSGRRYRK